MVSSFVPRIILLVLLATEVASTLPFKGEIRRCSETGIESGYYNNVFFNETCPPETGDLTLCGDDPITSGKLYMLKDSKGARRLKVNINGAKASTLYSIYYLPIGANPCSEKVLMSEFLTNKSGGYVQRLVRNCGKNPWPSCLNNWKSTTDAVDPYVELDGPEAGYFFFYSRGYSKELNSNNWKTVDGTAYGALENPPLWDKKDRFEGIQFIVGI